MKKLFLWLMRWFNRSNDPIHSCDLYRDKTAGSCVHVDGPLCDFPMCSMLADYRQMKEGVFSDETRACLREYQQKSACFKKAIKSFAEGGKP